MLLPEQPSSWVGILEQRRIGSEQTAIEVGIEQLRAVLPQVRGRPVILLADRWYATASFVHACHELGCQALIRLKRNRKLYRAAPRERRSSAARPANMARSFRGHARDLWTCRCGMGRGR